MQGPLVISVTNQGVVENQVIRGDERFERFQRPMNSVQRLNASGVLSDRSRMRCVRWTCLVLFWEPEAVGLWYEPRNG